MIGQMVRNFIVREAKVILKLNKIQIKPVLFEFY